jgi:hypothetical protein
LRVRIGFPAQQRVRIDSGAIGLVAELDDPEIAFRPLPSLLGGTESPRQVLMAEAVDPPDYRSASRRRKPPSPAAGCHPRRSALR